MSGALRTPLPLTLAEVSRVLVLEAASNVVAYRHLQSKRVRGMGPLKIHSWRFCARTRIRSQLERRPGPSGTRPRTSECHCTEEAEHGSRLGLPRQCPRAAQILVMKRRVFLREHRLHGNMALQGNRGGGDAGKSSTSTICTAPGRVKTVVTRFMRYCLYNSDNMTP